MDMDLNLKAWIQVKIVLLGLVFGCLLIGESVLGTVYGESMEISVDSPILVQANRLLGEGKGNHAKAVYEAYLTEHPQNAKALLGLAEISERYSNYSQARAYLESALSRHPDNVAVIATLARLYHRWSTDSFGPKENYSARAEEYFIQGKALDPDHPLLLAYQGEWHLDQGHWVSAQRDLQRAIRLNPRCIPAFQGLTQYYVQVKDYARARDTLLQAFELAPENSRSHFQMAQLLAYSEHPDKAIQYALRSEQLDFGRNPERNLFLAQQFEKLGNTTQAIEYFTEVTKDSPNYTGAILRLAQLYEQKGDMKQSQHFYEKAIANDPRILTNLLNNARTRLRQEKTGPAGQLFFKVLWLDTSQNKALQEEVLNGLASAVYLDAYYKRTDSTLLSKVSNTLEQHVKERPSLQISLLKAKIAKEGFVSPSLKSELRSVTIENDPLASGEAFFLLGQYAESQKRLDQLDGETAQGYLALGDRLLLLQALVSASAMYQRGFQMEPLPEIKQGLQRVEAKRKLADRRITEGNRHFNQKEYLEAIRPYEDAKKIVPGWEVPLLRLADTYEQLKQPVSAFYAYQQAVQINAVLMESEGFAKKYRKLEKKTRKIEAKEAKR